MRAYYGINGTFKKIEVELYASIRLPKANTKSIRQGIEVLHNTDIMPTL